MDWDKVLEQINENYTGEETSEELRHQISQLQHIAELKERTIKALDETIEVLKGYVDWEKIRESKVK